MCRRKDVKMWKRDKMGVHEKEKKEKWSKKRRENKPYPSALFRQTTNSLTGREKMQKEDPRGRQRS